MLTRLLTAILLITMPVLAWAQENAIVPSSQEEVKLSFAPLVKKISPAVVNIYTKRVVAVRSPFMDDPMFAPFFKNGALAGRMRKQVENALGSGLIVGEDGLVVTNAHVTRGADEITVVLSDGREFDGKVVLKDDPSDVTLLRIDTKGEKLPYAVLKPSESLEVGDLVLAIGNPFGVGQTVTSGIVSALARSSLNVSDFNFFIQTDAAINPGNSGGPLVAMDGGVVGINSAIYSRDGGSLGIGFAIPSEMVATVIAAEKAGTGTAGGVTRPWLGVSTQNITGEIAASLGMAKPAGVLIASLHPASPMLKAGVKAGDVVLAINGHQLHDSAEAKFRMATMPIGQTAQFEISRKGVKQTFDVEAIAPPDTPARQETLVTGDNPLNGAAIANINPAVQVQLGLGGEEKGVVITRLKAGSYSSRLLREGDIMVEINGKKIGTVQDAKAALSQKPNVWALAIKRQGNITKVMIR
jgi:Do/DeqQ family serine protease